MHYLWNDMCYADRRNRHLGWFSCSYGLYVSCGRNGEMEHERSGSLYSGPFDRRCIWNCTGFLCRIFKYPAIYCDDGGNVLRKRYDGCTDQVSISSNEFFVKLANAKIKLPFGSYVNGKGVVQVPFIRISVVVALVVLVVVFLMLRYTKFGRSLYAVGGSEQSATMMGLDVKKTKLKAYVLSSFLCSIGGICYCLNTMSGNVQQALGLEMDAIASSVIGGTLLTGGVGNVIGSFFGVLINGTISTLVKTNGKLLSSWSSIAVAALLCFFIVLQSIFAKMKESSK